MNGKVKDFLNNFDDNYYPDAFSQEYEVLECLANNQMGETLLVKDSSDTYFIAKCYTDLSLLSKMTESELLKKLSHPGLPRFKNEYKNENMLCVVREYAEGTPLDRLKKPLTERQTVSVGMQLCDILSYLHRQQPPVIHRDLKPQNIVMDDEGKITLIDFGISRTHNEKAQKDTVFFGTQEFAPPEQYGFAQTDCRADIYSLGVVLAWMLTGKTDVSGFRIKNKCLEHIVRKCTAFAPKDRYKDAKSIRRALANADGHKIKRIVRISCAVLTLIAVLSAGFAIGRFTDVRPPLFYNNSYAYFSEPLVEQAVRLQLDKAEGEPIRADELDKVKELYIYAGHTVKTQGELNVLREQVDRGEIEAGEGDISNLNDIARLNNLQNLSLGYQKFKDISRITQLGRLQSLELYFCPISDIRAIRQLPKLKHLILSQCDNVTDLSPLADCPYISELVLVNSNTDDFSALKYLEEIDYIHMIDIDLEKYLPYLKEKTIHQFKIAYSTLSSFDDLKSIESLENLELDGVKIKTLSGIEELSGLKSVSVWNIPGVELTPLVALPNLETVTLTGDMREAAKALEGTNIEIVYR